MNLIIKKPAVLSLCFLIGINAISCMPANAEFDIDKVAAWNQEIDELSEKMGPLIKAQKNADLAGERSLSCDFNVGMLVNAKRLVELHETKASYFQRYSMKNMVDYEINRRAKVAPMYNVMIRNQIDCDQQFPNKWPFLKSSLNQ